ncbi:MAG: hypothetical protein AB8U25_05525 [Rickettsiales endosymbiont of Dermacentor nuttalli]
MLYIKPLNELYLRLETKQQLSKVEREKYAKEIYRALSTNELKDKEFALYYMNIDNELQMPNFNNGKEFTDFLAKKANSSDLIKRCMDALIRSLMNDAEENIHCERIFERAIFDNIEQFTKDFKRSGSIIIQQNQEESLIFCQDLSVKKIDKDGNIIFKGSPLASNTSSGDGRLECLPYVLRDYICNQSGLPIDTPDKALYNLGKWPKIVGKHVNSLGVKEYKIEINDESLKLGKVVFAEPIVVNDIRKYCYQYNLPVMMNYQDIENQYQKLKQEILDYKNQESGVRVDDSIEHIQAYLHLSDQELRYKLEEENMARYKDHQLDLIAFIKLLKEDYKLPDQDINNFISIHHQGLVKGIQLVFYQKYFVLIKK